MHKSIISFTCATFLTFTTLTVSPSMSMAAPQAKAPTSVDSCMLLLVTLGNRIEAAKLKGKALADARTKGQAMAMQCQTKKYADAFATYQVIIKSLAAK